MAGRVKSILDWLEKTAGVGWNPPRENPRGHSE